MLTTMGTGINFLGTLSFAFSFLASFSGPVSSLGTCQAGEFRCQTSGHCVPREQVCDGVRDCDDGLDETDLICSPKYRRSLCGAGIKKAGVFQCQYGGCVPISRVCDGAINCLDGSDETEHVCGGNSCLPGQFRCKYGACIPDWRLCNGQLNCPDGSDETIDVCKKTVCKADQFMCKYGACIAGKKICDGWKNCVDGSDEVPELCLITRAKMQANWERAEFLNDTASAGLFDYRANHAMLSLTRRPTQGTSPRPTPPTTTTEPPENFIKRHPTVDTPSGPSTTLPPVLFDLFGSPTSNCTLPPIPANAEATITSCRLNPEAAYCVSNSNVVPFGVQVDYQCGPGYLLNGPVAIACQKSGKWTSPPPNCEAIIDVRYGFRGVIPQDFRTRCPPIQASRGVQVECIDPKNLEVKSCDESQDIGVDARFTCHNYYRPSGDLPVHYEKCSSEGQWTPGIHSTFSCVPDCGLSEAPKTPYILNGQPTKMGQWPWHVGIYIWSSGELKYICGGVLITEQSVLTSAHCVTLSGHLRNASSFVLYIGKQKIDIPDNDPFVQRRLITQVIVEDSFNHLALDSDIALLALDKPAVLSFAVRPACYPQASNSFLEEYQLTQGNRGTVIGWGLTENGTLSSSLRMTELPVVSASDCAESHRDFFATQTRSTTYCAGYQNGTSVCNGDSGGGMFFRAVTRGSSRWYVQGLVSYGVPEEGTRKCASNHYAIFTRVGRYADWIVRTLSKENLI